VVLAPLACWRCWAWPPLVHHQQHCGCQACAVLLMMTEVWMLLLRMT
jgi:hypothetical protein